MPGVGAWIRNGWPIPAEQLEFAVQHYRVAILQPWELTAAATLKAARPDMTVLAYKSLSSSRDYESGPIFSSGIPHAEAVAEDLFARRLDGSRIEWTDYPGHWQLRPWDPDYRRRWLQNVVPEIATTAFDGVFADNDVFDDYYGLDWPITGISNAAELRAGLTTLVHEAGAALNAAGKILVPNIAEARREPGRWDSHAAFGGGMEETWLGWAPDKLYDADTALAQMHQLTGPGLSLLRVPTDGDDQHPNFRYGLAAFWVFGGGAGAYTATGRDDHSTTQWIPQLDWDLGRPLSEPMDDNGAWTREFSAGWAAVNLHHDRTVHVRAPGCLIDAQGGPARRRVTLAPHRGLLLRRA